MIVGVLSLELFLPAAQSLKDKRSALKSLRDQLRGRFNIAVAEVSANDKWQRALVGVTTVGEDRAYVQALLRQVTDWVHDSRLVELIRADEEYL